MIINTKQNPFPVSYTYPCENVLRLKTGHIFQKQALVFTINLHPRLLLKRHLRLKKAHQEKHQEENRKRKNVEIHSENLLLETMSFIIKKQPFADVLQNRCS